MLAQGYFQNDNRENKWIVLILVLIILSQIIFN